MKRVEKRKIPVSGSLGMKLSQNKILKEGTNPSFYLSVFVALLNIGSGTTFTFA